MVDCASNEWIPIVSGVPQGSVFGPLLFILYTSEMLQLVENILYMPMLMTPHYLPLFASKTMCVVLYLVSLKELLFSGC